MGGGERGAGSRRGAGSYPSRASTFWEVRLAVASTEVPAEARICARVSSAVSLAKSASRIFDSLAVMFSKPIWRDRMLV